MKNMFKYLGAFAIAGALGLSTVNVSAEETCEAGYRVHTNYYMFLDVGSVESYELGINGATADSPYTKWTGADKYNTIQGSKIISHGDVPVTRGSETTSETTGTKTWTVGEYWENYYFAWSNSNSNLYASKATESYFLHDHWWKYDNPNFNGGEKYTHSNTDRHDALMGYIESSSQIASSSLATRGTMLPDTSITIPTGLETSTKTHDRWNITRTYATENLQTGVSLGSETVLYAPAVYYVDFCVEDTSTPVNKEITYDPNTTDQVTGMPGNTTFTESCTNVSATVPVRSGYVFKGWTTSATSTTVEYASGAEYCGDSVVLHAVWEAAGPFTVTYDANGGKDAPAAQSSEANKCVTISSTKPTLSGNNFLGWSTNKDAQEADANFAAGKNYCGEQGSITLYAVWQTQTGVSAHLIAFSIIALVAGTALVVAQKKNLFKQI